MFFRDRPHAALEIFPPCTLEATPCQSPDLRWVFLPDAHRIPRAVHELTAPGESWAAHLFWGGPGNGNTLDAPSGLGKDARSMKTSLFLAILIGFSGASLRSQEAPPAYETPPVLQASEALNPLLLSGLHHQVGEKVTTEGYANTYTLTTTSGTTGVSGTGMLLTRIREANAIAKIAKLKQGKEFTKAVGDAAKSPLAGAKSLITAPIETIGNVPRGAGRIFSRIGEGMKGGNRSEYEDRTLKNVIGYSKAKRRLAYELQIDPYSSNKVLQDQLNSLAWANYAGGMGVTAGLTVASGGTALIAVKGLKKADDFAAMIRDSTPTDLRVANRKKLEAMKIPKEAIQAFFENVWYSPTTESALVLFLERLGPVTKGRVTMVKAAATARNEFEAVFYTQTARLMALYHQDVGIVEGITNFHGFPVCYNARDELIVPLDWDYAAWTQQVATAVDGMRTFKIGDSPVTGVHLQVSGKFSDRAKRELAVRGVTLTENAFGR